jgi:L-threonylcarbamoyladenylate synthase
MDQLGDLIPYILDGGPCSVGVESTIIGWEKGSAVLYRPGGIALEEIEHMLGYKPRRPAAPADGKIAAPGMLASHYAPHKPVHIGDVAALLRVHAGSRAGVISFSRDHHGAINEVLSRKGDLHEAARGLFAALRKLDASDVDLIFAEVFPDEGLGRAINDRLKRASASR